MENSINKNQYLLSTAIIIGVAILCYPFTEWIGYRSIALLLLLVVSILGMRLQLKPVLLAATLSALIWDFFFIPPKFTFSIGSKEDILLLIMYFIVALSNGIFNYKLRQFDAIKSQKEERESTLKLYNTLFDSLSHELRTPIATILGASDALEDNEAKLSKKDAQELRAEISNAALRLNYQVENLLSASRLDSGVIKPNFEWCDTTELVYNVLNKLAKPLSNYKTIVEISNNMPLVKLDFGLTETILLNLIRNATIHTPYGSIISVNATILLTKEGHFQADENIIDSKTHTLILEVNDNGNGIAREEIDNVFVKFYRNKNTKTSGTGLGLYIAKGFVEAQQGTIKAVNNIQCGVTFRVEIPTTILMQSFHHESI